MRDPYRWAGLDELDADLIRELHADGRASWPRIASALGCSASTARRRFEALYSGGAVRVIGRVDAARLGLGVPAMVQFTGPASGDDAFLGVLRDRADVRFLSGVAGAAGSVAEFVTPGPAVLQERLRALTAEFDITAEPFIVTHIYTSGQDWLPDSVERLILPRESAPFGRQLNQAELTVLGMLMRDGRTSLGDLAAAIGKSENTARRTLDSLRERGILEFRVLIEPSVLGFETELLIWLEVEPARLAGAGERLAGHPGTKFLAATAGRYGLVGQIVLPHHTEIYGYVTDVLGGIEGLRRMETLIQTKVCKRVWNPVEQGRYVGAGGAPDLGALIATAQRG